MSRLTSPNPELKVEPSHLDFGIFDLSREENKTVLLTISNRGTGILAGRINPQVTWIQVAPIAFRCNPGEANQHQVILTRRAPRYWKENQYITDYLLLINSNGGSSMVGGRYILKPDIPAKESHWAQIWLVIPIGLIILMLFFIYLAIKPLLIPLPTQPDTISMLYTQGAETVLAKVSALPLETAAYRTAEASSLFLVTTLIPTNTRTPITPQPTVTWTSWPRMQYPNPEQSVRDYYSLINNRHYDQAWSMLSTRFQQACCSIGGNQPFDVYSNWWETIEKVDVLSAYLQQWDSNPAIVHVSLRMKTKKGEIIDAFYVFYLIADPDRKVLLIDIVK